MPTSVTRPIEVVPDKPFTDPVSERTLLGIILLNPDKFGDVLIDADDFGSDLHRRLYRAMNECAAEGEPIDDWELLAARAKPKFSDMDLSVLKSVTDGVPRVMDAAFYAKQVRRNAGLRLALRSAEQLFEDARAGDLDVGNRFIAEGLAVNDLLGPDTQAHNSALAIADMPAAVLDGRLGELYTQHLTRFPLAYAWGALLTAAGALIPRGNRPLRTNLFWCAVGPAASGKSATTEAVFRLLGMWSDNRTLLKGKFGSAEGLIEQLQEIEPDGVRLLCPDELGHLLEKAAIQRSSFPYILNTSYYDDVQKGGSKGKPFNLDCRLSVAGGVVQELFGDAFGLATTGGLYSRFTFGLCPQPYEFLWRPFEDAPVTLRPVAAIVAPDVWDARDGWIKGDGVEPRVAEQALRAAYICACVDGRPTLRASELGPAFEFAQYQHRVRHVLAPNPGENPDAKCGIAVRNWLTAHPGWVGRNVLYKGIHAERLGTGVFNRCILNLTANHELELASGGHRLKLIEGGL
ncbi:MAG: DnaB-like helicase N-terminal domain-containing protein [Terriglobales bacterium]